MRIAYTGWTWLINHEDNHKWEFEQFLKEVSDLEYEAVENFAFITKYFDNDAAEVNRLLEKYNLELVNLYHHYSDDPEEDYRKALSYVDFMEKTERHILICRQLCGKKDLMIDLWMKMRF